MRSFLPGVSAGVRWRGLRRVVPGLGAAVLGTLVEYTGRMMALGAPGGVDLPYVSWWPDPSVVWISVLWLGWAINGLLFLSSRHRSVAAPVLSAVLFAVLLTDRALYSNHLYLLAMLAPLAAWAEAGERRVRLLPVTLMKLLVSIVYLFAALAKIHPVYLSGSVLSDYASAVLPALPLPSVLAWGSVALELFLAFGLWHRRSRRLAFVTGVVLHLTLLVHTAELLGVGVFGLTMVSCYPLFRCEAARPGSSGTPEA